MEILKDFITPGMRHRPMTNPASSLYKKKMEPKHITIHNAYSSMKAKALHNYCKSERAAARPASWHFSIDELECYQAAPTNEVTWTEGDNLGPGNTTSISIEICDYAMLLKPQNEKLFLGALDHTARLCAYLINTEPTLRPFPYCMKQHWDWTGKNCPSWIRRVIEGWDSYLKLVEKYIKINVEVKPIEIVIPVIEPIIDNKKLISGIDPDIDRDWIEENEDKFTCGRDPYAEYARKKGWSNRGRRLWLPRTKIKTPKEK